MKSFTLRASRRGQLEARGEVTRRSVDARKGDKQKAYQIDSKRVSFGPGSAASWEGLRGSWDALVEGLGVLRSAWMHLGNVSGASGGFFGASEDPLGGSWRHLGSILGRFGRCREGLGTSWEDFERLLGRVAKVCSRRLVFSHVFSTCCRKVKICFIWSILQKHGKTIVFPMFFRCFYG